MLICASRRGDSAVQCGDLWIGTIALAAISDDELEQRAAPCRNSHPAIHITTLDGNNDAAFRAQILEWFEDRNIGR